MIFYNRESFFDHQFFASINKANIKFNINYVLKRDGKWNNFLVLSEFKFPYILFIFYTNIVFNK